MTSANLMGRLSELKGYSGTAYAELPGWTVTLEMVEGDALSCRLDSLALLAHRRDPLSAAEVEAWARGVAGRVTGLLEPLRVIEIDHTEAVAMLRSDKPAQRDGELAYYELMLQSDRSVALRRFLAFAGEAKPRVGIPFAVTHEVLAKFVEDVAA